MQIYRHCSKYLNLDNNGMSLTRHLNLYVSLLTIVPAPTRHSLTCLVTEQNLMNAREADL